MSSFAQNGGFRFLGRYPLVLEPETADDGIEH
jgi:hypothetical protein